MTLLCLSSLTKHYTRKRDVVKALKPIDLTINAGESVAFAGINGAGKSTLLKLLAGIEVPTSGNIWFSDSRMDDPDFRIKHIGFAPRDLRFNGRLTAAEELGYLARLRGYSSLSHTPFYEAVHHHLRLQECLDKRCDQLSTGQYQRVVIATALIHKPAIVLLDEPTTGLDFLAQAGIAELVREIRNFAELICIATHSTSEMRSLCDRVVYLAQGNVLLDVKSEVLIDEASSVRPQYSALIRECV